MPPNSFPGQTPPPPSVHTPPVGPVHATGKTGCSDQAGQTGAMVQSPPSPTPLATIPSSAAPSRIGEIVGAYQRHLAMTPTDANLGW